MFARFFGWLFPRKCSHPDVYHVASVTSLAELEDEDSLPLELRFVLKEDPGRRKDVEALLTSGYGIGVRTVEKTPRAILEAVEHISRLTQENTLIPWLPRLLCVGDIPTFTESELRIAERQGVALYEEARRILEHRYEFKKIVLIDLCNQGVLEAHRQLILALNKVLYPHASEYAVHCVLSDKKRVRTNIPQAITRALLFVAPVAHALEYWMSGVGKIFAAFADEIFGEAMESFALHRAGLTWRRVLLRLRVILPVFVLAAYAVFMVERLVDQGRFGVAGFLFGASVSALSLTVLLRSTRRWYEVFVSLERDGKLRSHERGLWHLALRQDFSSPAHVGLLVGALAAPVLAAIVFVLFPSWTGNGWLLALLGSAESLVGGVAILIAPSFQEWRFHRRMRRLIATA